MFIFTSFLYIAPCFVHRFSHMCSHSPAVPSCFVVVRAWRGVAWSHGVAWSGVARHDKALRGKAWHGKAWQGVARCAVL